MEIRIHNKSNNNNNLNLLISIAFYVKNYWGQRIKLFIIVNNASLLCVINVKLIVKSILQLELDML